MSKKPENGQVWVMRDDVLVESTPTYSERRIMAYGNEMMCVENTFVVGDTAPPHHHPNIQISYIPKGKFEFTINGETKVLNPGDSAYIGSDVEHSVLCLEDGIVLDLFTPMRKDFV